MVGGKKVKYSFLLKHKAHQKTQGSINSTIKISLSMYLIHLFSSIFDLRILILHEKVIFCRGKGKKKRSWASNPAIKVLISFWSNPVQ